ncbi:PFL family protein [Peptoniphilus sp. KCTC 25270]|uniref:PFL family protein n=1 Tax=Peptoniphilus sp. KCTC 25270 TaxID=2897414 RepID=UPI001E5EF560|nr:PFL family protein [Peptoniphilus sp. KCTC 25270]MCD1146614.1 PFL family protein [Peptoniphilus sp. KCTC 25270]
MDQKRILDTIHMLDQENLDIRTATIGISLLDCMTDDLEETKKRIYDKIYSYGKDLVQTADAVGRKYGVQIINKRISVTPVSLLLPRGKGEEFIEIAKVLDEVAEEIGVDFVGGYSALVHKGMRPQEEEFLRSIPKALASTNKVCSSVNVGSTKSGLNMEAVSLMGKVIKETAELTKGSDSIGCAKLVVFANAVEDNPFMAGAFHGVGLGDVTLHVGISGPGVVKHALESYRGEPFQEVSNVISKMAFKITRMGELIGKEIAERLEIGFGSIDLSLAPTPAIGDSVARILEEIGIGHVGGHGTTAALALLNDAVKKGGIMASTHVGGLSGAFIPVSEDEGMIQRAREQKITLDKLEAMTCVCSVGLDMVAIPGRTKDSTIGAMIADEAMVGIINQKTTAVRIIPVIGKDVGEEAVFGGLLGSAPIMPVHENEADAFVARGGFIPAPIHSFKN